MLAACGGENHIIGIQTPGDKVTPTAAWDSRAASSVLPTRTPTSTAEVTTTVPATVVPLLTQGPDTQAVRFFLNVESVAENVWSCIGDADGSLRCSGISDPDNLTADRWTCGESAAGAWECRGNLDEKNLRPELWGCKNTVVAGWDCTGNIDGTDATMERWTCKMKADGFWLCEGNIDKSTSALERWSCTGTGVEWTCSRDLGRLFPLVVPVISTSVRPK